MILIERAKFIDAFSKVALGVPARGDAEQTSVLMENGPDGFRLASTNGTSHMTFVGDPWPSPNNEPVRVLLPTKLIHAILKEWQGETTFELSDSCDLVLKKPGSEFKLQTPDVEKFPKMPELVVSDVVEMECSRFKSIYNKTFFATDEKASNAAVGGVRFNVKGIDSRFDATDSRRLSRCKTVVPKGLEEFESLVPASLMKLAERVIGDDDKTMQAWKSGGQVAFRVGGFSVFGQELTGKFPNADGLLKRKADCRTRVNIQAAQMLRLVRQVSTATNAESVGIDFDFQSGRLVLSATHVETEEKAAEEKGKGKPKIRGKDRSIFEETAKTEMPISLEGTPFIVRMDGSYMRQFLSAVDGETVEFNMISADDPVFMSIDGFEHVLMPLSRD